MYRRMTLNDFDIFQALFCAFDKDADQTIDAPELFTILKMIDAEIQ